MDMLQAGYGDIIGKYSCLNDWKLSAFINGEYFCQTVYDLTYEMADKVKGLAKGVVNRDENAIGALMEALVVVGIAMAFEMATYGAVAALMYRLLPKKKAGIYISLITAMIAGRVVWGAARMIIAGVTQSEFTWSLFIGGALLEAIPGIILQLILIPVIVMAVKRERV